MYDLIVIGGGPAGLVAAVYAIRQRLNILLVAENLGGKTEIRSEFAHLGDISVIRGWELVQRFKNEVSYLDIVYRLDRVRSVRSRDSGRELPSFLISTESGENLETRSVIVASGCRFKPLDIPGASKFLLKGIGHSAVSYAHLFLDRTAVVIGGGPRAVGSALKLAYLASHVYVILLSGKFTDTDHRSPAIETLRGRKNITLLEDYRVTGFSGNDFAEEVLLEGAEGSQKRIQAEGFFLESEAIPNSELVARLVERDTQGYISVDSRNNTSCRGIAAAGDVTTVHPEQVLVAVGEGAKAALTTHEYLFEQLR
jgi:thioredoxin reductase